MDKELNFIVDDEELGEVVITGNVDETLRYIASYLRDAQNGDILTFTITRRDMTQDEINAAPEI